ncbi:reverse transcriptase [Corchorus capsularis]|uniref:Reverse transcriptase n=1 Tax=Corchorus capsularis TaxID=210143 RepID=A0A1R3GHV5_COCAP|nr:reverse transcriptase [Corchorus capsularis]
MAAALAAEDLSRQASMSSRRSMSSKMSWRASSVREMFNAPDVFQRSSRQPEFNDEEELRWAAIERLPTYDRLRKGMLTQVTSTGNVMRDEVDVTNLGPQAKKQLMDSILKVVEEDNERFLTRLRNRIDRVGIEVPKIEVRFQNLSVEGDAFVGTRALPTLINSTLNAVEATLGYVGLTPSKKRVIKILQGVSGVLKPSRMTLLLGPPASGKTTLLQTLAGKAKDDLRISGKVTYCGHEFTEFIPQRTSAYISQHDLHNGEMTVRETLDFAGRCLGVGTRYEMLAELSRREKEAGIKPDPEIDAFMKATAMAGQETSLITDYVLKILGLDICADILVGDDMRRGISGGQKKRVTTGEMLVGPAKAFFMDEISTGLDSSTTFQIVKFMKQMVHIMDITMIISLLQPAPETFDLFDDIMLLSEGQIVYQGPRENVLEFFESMGFKCPERKGVADFLQEVTSRKDQEQYWVRQNRPYRYVSAPEFAQAFNSFHIGQQLSEELRVPFDKSKSHPAALVTEKYGISNNDLFKACLSREWLLMKRSTFLYIFKVFQLTVMAIIALTVFLRTEMKAGQLEDSAKFWGALFFSLINVMFNGMTELAMTVFRLPVFFKQRDSMFYPAWAFALPIWLTRIPVSLVESGIWIILTYYTIGFAPGASRFFKQFLAFFGVNQMALSLFRFIAALGRTEVVANTLGTFTLLLVFVLGGFIVAKDAIEPWMIWGYYVSPMMYGQNAIAINEFLADRWSTPLLNSTVGKTLLKERGLYTEEHWYWICIGALAGFSLLFNLLFIAALTYLNPLGDSRPTISDDDSEKERKRQITSNGEGIDMPVRNAHASNGSIVSVTNNQSKKGMVLPFQPLSLAFNHVNYYVDMPEEMKNQGIEESRLQLLRDVSGAFRPGILTALVGVSGAGKTTLMDVLAGRKTGGYIEGSISISGYPKNQATFARVSGYCEQNDIHSPHVTVYESLLYSAWLRLASDVKKETRNMFVEEVMDLIELNPLRHALVGLPGVNGLSTEQRKRLTIAVELVANPSIIFMDEPTSGLDARAAAIVMRTVRNTVDTGRTVVCTIHQPSIDIFEAFDELLLMKRGGQVIYAGALGRQSHKLVEYFEAVPGVPKIKEGYNPATWMLDVTSTTVEGQLEVDFAEIYANSDLNRRNQELIKELSSPQPGSKDLYFPTKYSQSFVTQCKACFWKQYWSYWRNSQYNAVRMFMTIIIGILFGVIFWNKGDKINQQQDLMNLLGATYAAVLFLGATNATSVQSVVSIERTVFYRERAAGMYSELPYAFAQVAIETIYVAFQTLMYSLLLYSMIGYEWQADKFFYFYYFIFMCFTYMSMYGMMVVALTPGHQIAAIVSSFLLSFWNLFSGFLVPRPLIPIWWRWYYWGSPVAWTIYGIFTSQIGDKVEDVTLSSGDKMAVNRFLKDILGFDEDFLKYIVLGHVAWVLDKVFLIYIPISSSLFWYCWLDFWLGFLCPNLCLAISLLPSFFPVDMAGKSLSNLCSKLSIQGGEKEKVVIDAALLKGGKKGVKVFYLLGKLFSKRSAHLETVQFTTCPFWIRIPDLPIGLMTEDIGFVIGESIGKVLEIDLESGRYLRLRVNLDLSMPVQQGTTLSLPDGELEIVFKYENMAAYCRICGLFDHLDTDRPLSVAIRKTQGVAVKNYTADLKAESPTLKSSRLNGEATLQGTFRSPLSPESVHQRSQASGRNYIDSLALKGKAVQRAIEDDTMSCELISKVRIHDGEKAHLLVKGTGTGLKQVEALSGNAQFLGDGLQGSGQFRLGKHTVPTNSFSDGRRLSSRQVSKMPAWLAERRFNTQARTWKGKAVMSASEDIGDEDDSVEIVKVVTGNKGLVAKNKGLSVLATENLICSENVLIEGTDESPSPADVCQEVRDDVPPATGTDPAGAASPNADAQRLLHEMAAISPFVFGLNSPADNKKPRKWKKAARVSSKYTFDALASPSNLKDGRKRGTTGHCHEAVESGAFKRTRETIVADLQDEAGTVECNGRAGGLALLWIKDLPIYVLSYSQYHIDAQIGVSLNDSWRFTGFYGRPETQLRMESWNLLRRLNTRSQLPWLCSGDFNEIISNLEKVGGALRLQRQMSAFLEAISDCSLRELPVRGPMMTWRRRIGDKSPIFIPKYRQFRFERMWCHHPDFYRIVERSWVSNSGASVPEKILACGGDSSDLDFCQKELNNLLQQEEVMWCQRSKSLWLRDGDRNTGYFHTVASSRRQRCIISSIQDENGVCFSDAKSIERIIEGYFKNIFSSTNPNWDNVRSIASLLERRIDDEQGLMLDTDFTFEEIKDAVFQMEGDKAPGPDGMTQTFFQQCWGLIGKDVASFCLDFLNNGEPLPSINHTNICLIPKNASPSSAKDYRPISLCNVLFKIISKALANRLKLVLPNLIGDSQSAFVPDRMIYDNAMIPFETIHFMQNKRVGRKAHMALKLDLSKAYDQIEWKFLAECMRRLGFSARWIHLVMTGVRSVSYSVLINGNQSDCIYPSRGIRQGDPLSPYLFLLCMEALSKMISNAASVGGLSGVSIARHAPSVSHLFFADDSILFLRARLLECDIVLKILGDFEAASGQKINIDKSSILFSKNTSVELRMAIMQRLGIQRGLDGESCNLSKINFSVVLIVGIAWDSLCVSKADGGLGFKDFETFNLALLAKQCWRLSQNTDSLCFRVLKAKYFPTSRFMSARLGSNPSFLWRNLLAGRKILEAGSRRRVGFGQLDAWHDRWINNPHDYKPTPRHGIEISSNPVCVADLIDDDEHCWDADKLQELFSAEDVVRILCLPIPRIPREDCLFWNDSKMGEFNVRSAYFVARKELGRGDLPVESPPQIWRMIWSSRLLPKVRFFLWRLCWGILPLKYALQYRGVEIDNNCAVCGEEEHSYLHIFFNCPLCFRIWDLICPRVIPWLEG